MKNKYLGPFLIIFNHKTIVFYIFLSVHLNIYTLFIRSTTNKSNTYHSIIYSIQQQAFPQQNQVDIILCKDFGVSFN